MVSSLLPVSPPPDSRLRSDMTFPAYHSEDLRRTTSVWFTEGTKARSKCSHYPGSSCVDPRATSHASRSSQDGDDRFWRPTKSVLSLNSSSETCSDRPPLASRRCRLRMPMTGIPSQWHDGHGVLLKAHWPHSVSPSPIVGVYRCDGCLNDA